MLRHSCLSIALAAILSMAPAHAATIVDPVGDFLPSFVGPNDPDLDVLNFAVDFDEAAMTFNLGAVFAGEIDPLRAGLYVIGVNTGTGVLAPFGSIGQPNVIFNQAIVLRKDGTGNVGANILDPASIVLAGNILAAKVPLSFLPSTGFAPENYAFNLWPRNGLGNLNQISDFAPDNANLPVTPIPELKSWAMLVLAMGVIGSILRRRQRQSSKPLPCPASRDLVIRRQKMARPERFERPIPRFVV